MDRVKTGIDGLDELLEGGVPKSHTFVVMGSFGTGKTTFGLQFLNQGLANGEKGIYISLEEDQNSIIEDAKSHGWDLKPLIDSQKMVIVKLEPSDAKTTISRIKSELPDFISKFGASRIVFDSVSLLNMLFEDEHERRINLFNLSQMIEKDERHLPDDRGDQGRESTGFEGWAGRIRCRRRNLTSVCGPCGEERDATVPPHHQDEADDAFEEDHSL